MIGNFQLFCSSFEICPGILQKTDKQNLHIVKAVIWRIHIVALVLHQCFPELSKSACEAWEKRSEAPAHDIKQR